MYSEDERVEVILVVQSFLDFFSLPSMHERERANKFRRQPQMLHPSVQANGTPAAPRPPRALPPPFLLPSIVNMLLSLRPVSIVLNEQIFSYSVLCDFRQNRTNFWSEIITESCGIDFKNGPFPASFSLFSFFLYS